ncbi:PhzF family phenazine biosynthesis protein [Pantoea sp. FN0307]|uniref:PhzF family phenazine biosynthesis protein n=1 Tax=Pantoea sp. FN0307 TaxID=3418560 RepID=UPI003CFB5E0D
MDNQLHDYTILNAFTNSPLEGNPVSVFHNSGDISAPVMQAIARQLQLSESTFISEVTTDGQARVRIFTPVNELPFAGHPLMGAASAFSRRHGLEQFIFHTDIGAVKVTVEHHSSTLSTVKINVPPALNIPFNEEKRLLKALGLKQSVQPIEMYDAGARHVLVPVDSIQTLHSLRPDHQALAEFENLAVNCFTWCGFKAENRMFSPAYGVKEDAGTGSVVGPIALHLMKYGQLKANERLTIEQGILLNRRCVMHGEIKQENELVTHIELSGQVTLFSDCRAWLRTVLTNTYNDQ